jgi:predicted metalloprotease
MNVRGPVKRGVCDESAGRWWGIGGTVPAGGPIVRIPACASTTGRLPSMTRPVELRPAQLPVLVVVVVAIVAGARGHAQGSGADAEPFPPHVVLAAGAEPDVHGDRHDLRALQLLGGMNAMWQRAFAAAGWEYEAPLIEPRSGAAEHSCGKDSHGWAGIYCSRDRRIVIDLAGRKAHRATVGAAQADDLLAYVLAHEVAHHVQNLRGRFAAVTRDEIVRVELHAQCLAGAYGRAAGRAPPPDWSYAAGPDHGSVAQQRHWLETGHASGRPADCERIWG